MFKDINLKDSEALQLYLGDWDIRNEFYEKLSSFSRSLT
jgi:hypothetical protein